MLYVTFLFAQNFYTIVFMQANVQFFAISSPIIPFLFSQNS